MHQGLALLPFAEQSGLPKRWLLCLPPALIQTFPAVGRPRELPDMEMLRPFQ